jgi:hypothetical protein
MLVEPPFVIIIPPDVLVVPAIGMTCVPAVPEPPMPPPPALRGPAYWESLHAAIATQSPATVVKADREMIRFLM